MSTICEVWFMSSRALLLEAMQGKASRIPLYFWLADPRLEAEVGDVVGVRCWFERLNYLEKGGPFRRGAETRREWCDRIQPDEYDWPTSNDLITEMDEIVAETLKVDPTKSFQLEILGPSEYSEYSCSPGKTYQGKRLDQVSHQFDFSVLTLLDPWKAEVIHTRFFRILLDVAKRAAEYDAIDSVRIADDFCTYAGSIYRPDFTKTIVQRQVELGQAIIRRGKYSVLHSDGDLTKYLAELIQGYSGLHPLDIKSKSTLADSRDWAAALAAVRKLLPHTVFFTGIPVDLLCTPEVSANELVETVKHVIEAVGPERLVLTTTHRPYPGWSFRDFAEKVTEVKHFVHAFRRSP
jgi:hypothetical protein